MGKHAVNQMHDAVEAVVTKLGELVSGTVTQPERTETVDMMRVIPADS
jgi:hypothetical protein